MDALLPFKIPVSLGLAITMTFVVAHALNHRTGEAEVGDLCEFETNLDDIGRSGPARATL